MLSVSRSSAAFVRNTTASDALGAATLAGLEKLPEYQQSPQIFKDLLKPYFDQLTANLSVSADTKVSVTAALKVVQAYIAWIQANKVLETVAESFPKGDLRRDAVELEIQLFAQGAAQIAETLKDVPGTLKKLGVTERQVLARRLSPAMLARYDAGTLTISDLCKLEPRDLFILSDNKPQMQRAG